MMDSGSQQVNSDTLDRPESERLDVDQAHSFVTRQGS